MLLTVRNSAAVLDMTVILGDLVILVHTGYNRHFISNGFFENQPNEVCSHWSKKASNKGRFLKPEKLQNHNNEGKGEKERARRRK